MHPSVPLLQAPPPHASLDAAVGPLRPLDGAGLHPSDGPDFDVRARIDENGLHLRVSVNLAYVDEHVGFARELDDVLAEVEMPMLHSDLVAHLREAIDVRIDGVPVEPVADEPLSQLPGPQEMAPYNPRYGIRALTLVRIELDYPVPAAEADDGPQRVHILWKTFPPDLAQPMDDPPPMTARIQLNDGKGDLPLELTVAEPAYTWHGEVTTFQERLLPVVDPPQPRTVEIPVLSAGLGAAALAVLVAALLLPARRVALALAALLAAGAAAGTLGVARVEVQTSDATSVPDDEAIAVFESLHRNLYTAFDFDDREVVYDALAHAVAGEHLDQTYARVFRSLVLENDGGAVTRVTGLRHLETALESSGLLTEHDQFGFAVRTRWQVDGEVTHFGHTHRRTQEYAARFVVGETPDGWRILGEEVLEEFVVSAEQIDPRGASLAPASVPVDAGEEEDGEADTPASIEGEL